MEKIYLKFKMSMRFISRRRIKNSLRYITIALLREPTAPSKTSEVRAPIKPHSQLCTDTDGVKDYPSLWLCRFRALLTVLANTRANLTGDASNPSKLVRNWHELKAKYRPNLRLLKRTSTYRRAPVTRISLCLHQMLNNYKILSALLDLPLTIGKTKTQWSQILEHMCAIEAQSFLRFLLKAFTRKRLQVLTVSNSKPFRKPSTCCKTSKKTNASALCAKRSTTQRKKPSSTVPEDSAEQKQINLEIYEKCKREQEEKLLLQTQQQKYLWVQPTEQQEKQEAETEEKEEEFEEHKVIKRIKELLEKLNSYEPERWCSFGALLQTIINHEHYLQELLCFLEDSKTELKSKAGVLLPSDFKRKLIKLKTFEYYLEQQITYGEQLISKPYLVYLLENKIDTIPADIQIRYLFHLADVQIMALEIHKLDMEN